jgi:hypothetical protein
MRPSANTARDGSSSASPKERRSEAHALDVFGSGQTHEVERGRHDVDERGIPVQASPGRDLPGRPDEQRHAQDLVVEGRVEEVAVLVERLAVIGGDDDHGALVQRKRFQPGEQRSEGGVGEVKLARVGLACASSPLAAGAFFEQDLGAHIELAALLAGAREDVVLGRRLVGLFGRSAALAGQPEDAASDNCSI